VIKKPKAKRILTRVLITQTLEMMKLIEKTEEFADCFLWTGATSDQGYPIYKPFDKPCTLVRRKMFELNGGALEPRVPIVTTCGEKSCIHPAHLEKSTTQAVAKAAGDRGALSTHSRRAKIAAAQRKHSKLTLDDARAIRVSTESGPVLAERYGVHRTLISGIKAGTRWREYSGHWAGLM